MKRLFAIAVALLAMTWVACDDDPVVEPEPEKFLELSTTTLNALDTTGEYTFQINASHPWTAACEADWVTVKPIWGKAGEHTVTVTVATSDLDTKRTATIVVKSDQIDVTKEVKLTQSAVSAARLEYRKLYYTTTDGQTVKPLNPYNVFGGPTIESNKYSNGQGVMTLTADIKTIGSFAFREKHTLVSMKFPASLVEIGYQTFYNCQSLSKIELPEGLKTIGNMAFARCPSLTTVKIPSTVTKINESAFVRCHSLTRFEGKFVTSDGRGLIVNNVLVSFAPAGVTEWTVPNGVTTIQWDVFHDCADLCAVKLPSSLTTIGVSAFRNCTSLSAIELPANLSKLTSGAFYGCTSLTKVVLPDVLAEVEMGVFENCTSLKEVTIGSKVQNIRGEAFGGCTLSTVICKAKTPPTTGENFLGGKNADLVVKVPAASVEAYKAAAGWKEYKIEAMD